jgi:hypothetical protein
MTVVRRGMLWRDSRTGLGFQAWWAHNPRVRPGKDEDLHAVAYAVPTAPLVESSVHRDRTLSAFLSCAAAGGLTSTLTGIPYCLELRGLVAMDWPREGGLFFLFGCGIGAAVGAGSMGGMAIARRWLRASHALVRASATILGSTFGVAILGTVPGSIGTAHFGAKEAPFVGLVAITVVPFVGALATAAFAARAELRNAKEEVSWPFAALCSTLAIVPLAAAGIAVALTVPDDVALAWMRSAARALEPRDGLAGGLGLVGAGGGAVLGAALGLHVGVTTVLARLRTGERGHEPNPRS